MIKIPTSGKSFIDLPARIKNCHFQNGGRVLSERQKNRISWVTASPDNIATRITDAFTVAPSKPLWEAFADTRSNPSASVIKEFLRDIGVEEPTKEFDRFGGSSNWQRSSSEIDLFMSARNECAHTGIISTSPGSGVIRSYILTIDHVAETVVQILEDRLTTI